MADGCGLGDIQAMAHVELIVVPYDSGLRDTRMGSGPEHLLRSGIVDRLAADGHAVTVTHVASGVDPATEIAVTFDLARSIAGVVREARADGKLPIILAGNCFSALGTVAGLGPDRAGVLWLDAHGDLNTPDTTRSGMLDGMALATLTGRCWRELATTVPGFTPLPDHRLVLVGARDLDSPEQSLAAALGLHRLSAEELRRLQADERLVELLGRLAANADLFYLHVDLDVLDPDVAAVNAFGAPGGLGVEDVRTLAAAAARTAGIGAASLTAFDPSFDHDGRATTAAMDIACSIARA